MKICDLFAGAGGLSLGFHLAGYNTVFYNDIFQQAVDTFKRNFPEVIINSDPIQNLDPEFILDEARIMPGELDVLVGGPPCQGFSINAPERRKDDPRNHLFSHFIRILIGLRPKMFVLENVPGLYSFENGSTLRDVLEAFRTQGYSANFKILNSAHYGAPQERWRLIIIGSRLSNNIFHPTPIKHSHQRPNFAGGREHTYYSAINSKNQPTLFNQLESPVTLQEALGDLPRIKSGGGLQVMEYDNKPNSEYQKWARSVSTPLYNHKCSGLGKVNLDRLKHVPQGGSWRDIPYDLLPNGMKRARRSDHTKRYGRMHPEKLSGTILTKCDPHWGTFFHYDQDRIISVREAARIQSFPDWYVFEGSLADQYRQVGNAVPPLMAKHIAECVKSQIQIALKHQSSTDH